MKMRMARSVCPHCGESNLSCWKKLGLGPARRIPCPGCGKAISVAWLPSMTMIALSSAAFWLILIPISLFGEMELHWFFIAAAASIAIVQLPMAWAYCRLVPLVVCDQ